LLLTAEEAEETANVEAVMLFVAEEAEAVMLFVVEEAEEGATEEGARVGAVLLLTAEEVDGGAGARTEVLLLETEI